MTSETLRPSITLLNPNQTKAININYWQVAMAMILILVIAGFAMNMLNGAATLILSVAIVAIVALKPVYDILNADFNISLEHLDLKNIHEELWD